MILNEPMTLITDFAMGFFSLAFAVVLARRLQGQASRVWWLVAFALTGLASFAAGLYHGFFGIWPEVIIVSLDVATVLAMVGVSLCLLLGTVRAFAGRRQNDFWVVFALAKAVIFAAWNVTHRMFIFVIADYALALAIVALLSVWRWRLPAARWLVAGIAVSAFGALVQRSGYDPANWFNHNDLYHVIQVFSLYAFYRGALLLRDSRPAAT